MGELDYVGNPVNGGIIAKVIAIHFHYAMLRAAPGTGRWAARADYDYTLRSAKNVIGPVAWRSGQTSYSSMPS